MSTTSTWTLGGTITPTKSGNTYSYNASLGKTYDYQQSYNFKLEVVDQLTPLAPTYTVPQGLPVFNWGKDFFNVNGEYIKNSGYLPAYRGSTNNFNTCLTQGFYSFGSNNIIGSPINGTIYGTLEVIESNARTWSASNMSSWIWQIYRDTYGNEYQRIGINEDITKSSWKKILYEPKVLFDNATGIAGTVPLNETSANFDRIKIFGIVIGSNAIISCEVSAPNGKTVVLDGIKDYAVSNLVQTAFAILTISGTAITFKNNSYYNVTKNEPGYVGSDGANYMKIIKVLGYK